MKKLKFENGQIKDDDTSGCPHLTWMKLPLHKYYQCVMCKKVAERE